MKFMEKQTLKNYLNSINYTNSEFDDFWELGNATSLSEDTKGQKLEFYRGPLLYALICHLKPKKILEFGTGGGYSTLCMAKALSDSKIDGKIYTIDRVGNKEKISRFYQLPNDKQPQKMLISNYEIWKKVAKSEVINKIIPIQGYSGMVMDKTEFDQIDFCYVDGNHSYEGTKHDFLSFLQVASNNFAVLFDDYIDRDFYGVKEFVDKEIDSKFNPILIDSDPDKKLEQFVKKDHDYGMVYFEHKLNNSVLKNYNKNEINLFLKQYRNNDYRIRARRYNLEKKIPFLKNIKFKFWKNN
ncbi:MAG: hypothetical protein CXT78_07785 [Thaumarchaeota archaeon]|jgi:hypothetical protein|nr:MAG: hypothetical protein CXT78_07785 [Nitrososphaerota archaeon]